MASRHAHRGPRLRCGRHPRQTTPTRQRLCRKPKSLSQLTSLALASSPFGVINHPAWLGTVEHARYLPFGSLWCKRTKLLPSSTMRNCSLQWNRHNNNSNSNLSGAFATTAFTLFMEALVSIKLRCLAFLALRFCVFSALQSCTHTHYFDENNASSGLFSSRSFSLLLLPS